MEVWQSVLIGLLVGGVVGLLVGGVVDVIRVLCLCRKHFQELPPDEEDEE